MSDTDWMHQAACRGLGHLLFYSGDLERQPQRDAREAEAKAVCSGCPVRTDCLEYALERGDKNGLWGGLNEDERRTLDRKLKRRARTAAA